MRTLMKLLALVLLCAGICSAQGRSALSPSVRELVAVDAAVVVLQHVRVVDGTGAAARDDQTIIIAGEKIESIGNAAGVAVPTGAKVLDLNGYTVIPGLVGMHNHMYYPAPNCPPAMYPEHATSFPRLYLAGGVTTNRTTGSIETFTDLEIGRASCRERLGTRLVAGSCTEKAGEDVAPQRQ